MIYLIKSKKLALMTISITIVALLLASCSNNQNTSGASDENETGSSSVNLVDPKCLTVTYSENYLPKIATGDGDDELQGYDGYLATKVAEKLGVEVCPKPLPFDSQILSVKEGKADLGMSIYYTESRAKQIRYTKPNITDLQGLIVRKDVEYESPEEIEKLGTFSGHAANEYFFDNLGEDNITIYPGYAEALEALQNGQIDAYAGSSGTAPGALKGRSDEVDFRPFDSGAFGMGDEFIHSLTYSYVACDNKALAEVVNEVLDELISSGEWEEQRAEWGVEGEEYDPSDEEPNQLCAQ